MTELTMVVAGAMVETAVVHRLHGTTTGLQASQAMLLL